MKIREIIKEIKKLSAENHRVRITYGKRSTGRIIIRLCACYKIENNFLFLEQKGDSHIKSYYIPRILKVEKSEVRFRPKFEVEI